VSGDLDTTAADLDAIAGDLDTRAADRVSSGGGINPIGGD
jgi:hypothetical protein